MEDGETSGGAHDAIVAAIREQAANAMGGLANLDVELGLSGSSLSQEQAWDALASAMGAESEGVVATTPQDREYADLRAQLAESRSDTKLAEALGRMDAGFAEIKGRLDGIDKSTSGLRTTVIVTGIAAVGVVIAILSYGQAWFGTGASIREIVRTEMGERPVSPSPPPAK